MILINSTNFLNGNVPCDWADVSEVAERHEVVYDEGAVLVLFGYQVLLDQNFNPKLVTVKEYCKHNCTYVRKAIHKLLKHIKVN